MWHTHYYDKQIPVLNQEQRSIANRLYRALLATIPSLEHPSLTLLDIANAQWAKMTRISVAWLEHDVEKLFDSYFHEFSWLPRNNEVALFPDVSPYSTGWWFIKTAHKLYDLAVWMTLQAVRDATWVNFSSDSPWSTDTPWRIYALNEMGIEGHFDFPQMEQLQIIATQHIKAAGTVYPWLPLPDPADIVDDETRIWHLTIYGKANVWDLRHIADMIEKWELFSPADWSYQWQPSWVFTKS